ncbi:hypothetical protein LOZ80_05540 [Paenibacillus sp. HWE-109]|uniref:hypothetical protein n=1 Tax=Paenibacillus sp. HWE-109 TaxID=1306526 RepID=UPI001EE10282|nr:hypothetical protein [Paenibacillus sp. HWE-109]UKS28398.1 hypothetical protein LOZ80_05540 [Paenibacillus sp. HWE-109]
MRLAIRVKWTRSLAVLTFLTMQVSGGLQPASAATEKFPIYVQQATVPSLTAGTADIAGSAFVGKDGEFHWMDSLANYEQADNRI